LLEISVSLFDERELSGAIGGVNFVSWPFGAFALNFDSLVGYEPSP
jgi:hypothetical protein